VTRRWPLRLLAGALVGAAVLSGCSQKHQASDNLPTATAEPTEDALPPLGPDDMPMPAEARTQDAAGAEAFVRYYIALINRTSEVMDAAPIREFSDACEECDRIATDTENDAAAGHHYEGGELTLTRVGAPLVKDTTAEMAFFVDQAALQVVDQAGHPVEGLSFAAIAALSSGASARWDARVQSWIMTGLTLG
jgi:hypothetical protein